MSGLDKALNDLVGLVWSTVSDTIGNLEAENAQLRRALEEATDEAAVFRALLEGAREEAFEEAAKVALEFSRFKGDGVTDYADAPALIAIRIRALKAIQE